MNYPLTTPLSNRFPAAIISTLRCLSWLKSQGFESVSIVGESAGGQLGSMVAAYLHNPLLLTRLARDVDEPVSKWSYPIVKNCVFWYAILDQDSWSSAPEAYRIMTTGLRWCLDMYRSQAPDIKPISDPASMYM